MLSSKLAIGLAAACLVAATAQAAPPLRTVSMPVSYGDLDLDKREGAKTLYRRIKAAARTVCAPIDSRMSVFTLDWRKCYEGAIADAVAKVDRPTLTALHSERFGASPSVDRRIAAKLP